MSNQIDLWAPLFAITVSSSSSNDRDGRLPWTIGCLFFLRPMALWMLDESLH